MQQTPLNTTEAGKIAGRNKRTIVSWIHKGLLKAMKFPGGRGPYLIMEVDLRQTMKELYTPKPYEPENK
jgi:predicted site-specific integrase-resolvase